MRRQTGRDPSPSISLATAILLASLGLFVVAAVRWRWATPLAIATRAAAEPAGASQPIVSDDSLAVAEDLIASNDPFRLANAPAAVRFDPAREQAANAFTPAMRAPRPNMTLKAIVGGPPWRAIIDGLPGQPPGAVAEQGSRFDRLVVRAVTRDSVVVQGPDTAWVLSFRGRS